MAISNQKAFTILMMWMTLNSEAVADEKVCFQCATPNLQSNWGLTGLPLKPDNLKFDVTCDKFDGTSSLSSELTSANCASSCFEMMIPFNGAHEFVRGCHENFVWNEFKVTLTNVSCQLNLVKKDNDPPLYAGMRFCNPVLVAEDRCNEILKTGAPNGVMGMKECDELPIHTCKSCNEYDGTGSCTGTTSATCKSPYCVKTTGKMNDRFFESRGCAFFNPIGSNVCSWTDQVYNLSTGVDSVAISSRTKRGVSLSFRANQCYCQGELCNYSPRLTTILLSLFSVSFLAFL